MAIEEVIDRAIRLKDSIVIEYCTRSGMIFTCRISDIEYSNFNGGGYIQAYREDIEADRTFKICRILKVNGHPFRHVFWRQIGDDFKRIY